MSVEELRTIMGADHALFLTLHIFLIVTWVGMDIGVFTSSFFIRNPSFSIEQRLIAGKIGRILDMGPRTSILLMYPVGAWLTWAGGWGFDHYIGPFSPVVQLVLITLFFLAWEFGIWWQFVTHGRVVAGRAGPRTESAVHRFRRYDIYARWVLGALLIVDGALAFWDVGFIAFPWLGWKILLFGVVVWQGIGIRYMADAFPALIQDIVVNGSTPEREAALRSAMVRSYPFVLTLWGLVVVISVLGVVK